MKAKIVECRKLKLRERIKSIFIKEYVTVWQLENGKQVAIETVTKGGRWTHLNLMDKLYPIDKAKQEAEELASNIGIELTVGE